MNPSIVLNKIINNKEREDERKREHYETNQKTLNKMENSTFLSIITSKKSGQNAPIKRQDLLNR